jgi:hypothetical protein
MNEKITKKEKTFGQQYLEILNSETGQAPVRDIRSGALQEWDRNVFELIEKTRRQIPSRHFYIAVITKREHLAQNTIRIYYESKYDCPTPSYEQTVYKIKENSCDWSLLWTIPAKEVCSYMKKNKMLIPPEEWELLGYVLDFDQGKLDQKAQLENGEIVQNIN